MIRKPITATSISAALVLAAALAVANAPAPADAADPVETGRFVWHDLMTKDVSAAKRFYGELLGWRFEDTKRGDRPYVLARSGKRSSPVLSISPPTRMPARSGSATCPWLTSTRPWRRYGPTAARSSSNLGTFRTHARPWSPIHRVRRWGSRRSGATFPIPPIRRRSQFFWNEYLARDAAKALDFYKRLAGYEATVSESRLGVDYHSCERLAHAPACSSCRPSATGVEPNWLPYVLVDDPAALAARVGGLGGRILLPAAPERRNGSARRHRRSGRRAARAAKVSVLGRTVMICAKFVSRRIHPGTRDRRGARVLEL